MEAQADGSENQPPNVLLAASPPTLRYAEPLKEVVHEGKNGKYVRDCTELYLGRKGLEGLKGFERLVNLEALWLEHNRLEDLIGLQHNFRLKVLHLEGNKIQEINSLAHLKFLEDLDLSCNSIAGLESHVLPVLRAMQFLTVLNLTGNPICDEPKYRWKILYALPALQVLDMHAVTPDDREEAIRQCGGCKSGPVAFWHRRPVDDPAWRTKTPVDSLLKRLLKARVARTQALRDSHTARDQSSANEPLLYSAATPPLCESHTAYDQRSASESLLHTARVGGQRNSKETNIQQTPAKAAVSQVPTYKPLDTWQVFCIVTNQHAGASAELPGENTAAEHWRTRTATSATCLDKRTICV